MATLNDVIDYSKFYNGKDEPPLFPHQHTWDWSDLNNPIRRKHDD